MTSLFAPDLTPHLVLEDIERLRVIVNGRLNRRTQMALGQFTTPLPVARFMADLFPAPVGPVRLLDAGAGVGSLTAAAALHFLEQARRPSSLQCSVFEIDRLMIDSLSQTLELIRQTAAQLDVPFQAELHHTDFLMAADRIGERGPFSTVAPQFTHAILNPPYHKLGGRVAEGLALAARGLDTNNLYTAFLDLAVRLLVPGGELVAITPRSFFNGAYYRNFRQRFLRHMTFRRVHLINSRKETFRENTVLQETVIFHATKGWPKDGLVLVSYSLGFDPDEQPEVREVAHLDLVRPGDSESFIRVDVDEHAARLARRVEALPATLADLGLKASTGRVVDFRALHLIGTSETGQGQPLIYPGHLRDGRVRWPTPLIGKPNVIQNNTEASSLLVPEGVYVLVKRFSAKEEVRRVSASVYEPEYAQPGPVGFENHLNYIHQDGSGLPRTFALGLCAYLNSTVFDVAFRQFSGHTQVNATDLKTMRFPLRSTLERLGARLSLPLPAQEDLDALVQVEVFGMTASLDIQQRVQEAKNLLSRFELPKSAQNDRSALTLLALLDLGPDEPWSEAKQPLRGVTPIMTFCAERYGKQYQPNSRESFRKDTLHHWVAGTLAEINPDDPPRPTNSQKTVYRVHDDFLRLVRAYGTSAFERLLKDYRGAAPRREAIQAAVRAEHVITVTYGGDEFTLSPGGQNPLVKAILYDFCPEFAPEAELIYVGDTADKNAVKYGVFKKDRLKTLGVELNEHGKIPDVAVYRSDKNWLYLIEAVSSHGPFDKTRLDAIRQAFAHCTAGIVYVTAFPDRKHFQKYVGVIAWETEVWIASDPKHLIHFNGDRFMGPRP